MEAQELSEILFSIVMIGAWLAFSWHIGPEAFRYMAGFIACAVLSIPYHLHRARSER